MLGSGSALALAGAGLPHIALWLWAGVLAALVVALFVGVRSRRRRRRAAHWHRFSAQETRAIAALGTQTAPAREGRAESLAVGAATFSTSFDVTVDRRGAFRCAARLRRVPAIARSTRRSVMRLCARITLRKRRQYRSPNS